MIIRKPLIPPDRDKARLEGAAKTSSIDITIIAIIVTMVTIMIIMITVMTREPNQNS